MIEIVKNDTFTYVPQTFIMPLLLLFKLTYSVYILLQECTVYIPQTSHNIHS